MEGEGRREEGGEQVPEEERKEGEGMGCVRLEEWEEGSILSS